MARANAKETRMPRALSAALPLILLLSACGGEPEAPPASEAPGAPTGEVAAATSAADAAAAASTPAAARPVAFAQCASCHSVEPGKNGIGPSLAGVVGLKAGHDPKFAYSTSMRSSGLIWDEATLDRYLKDPRGTVPGTKMAYAGLKDDAKRAELIAWLKTI
jgi:cytochrome c